MARAHSSASATGTRDHVAGTRIENRQFIG
jgi:hypothetical protein